MDFMLLFICLLVFIAMQVLCTYVQMRQYKKAVLRLRKKGNIGIGSRHSKINNNIVIIACDNEGTIVDAEQMEGLTMFTKFRQIPEIIGKNIFALREEYAGIISEKEKKLWRGHIEAVKALCNKMENSNSENTVENIQ